MATLSYPAAPPKLGIDVLTKALAFPFENIPVLIRLAAVPTLISFCLTCATFYIFWPDGATKMSELVDVSQKTRGIFAVSSFLSSVIFAVGIHRYIISEEHQDLVIFRIRRPELIYILTVIAITLLAVSLMISIMIIIIMLYAQVNPLPFMTNRSAFRLFISIYLSKLPLPFLWLFLAWFPGVLLYARLALAVPHAAITGTINLKHSWNMMRGNFGRFIALAILFGFSLTLFSLALSFLRHLLPHYPTHTMVVNGTEIISSIYNFLGPSMIAKVLIGYLMLAAMVALISYSYKALEAQS